MGVKSAERRLCRLGGQERREGPLNPAVSEDNLAEESGSWAAGGRGAGCWRQSRRAPGSQVKCGAPHPGVWALRGPGLSLRAQSRPSPHEGGPHSLTGVRGALPLLSPKTPLSILKPGQSPGRDRWSSSVAREGLWVSSPLLFRAEDTSGALVRVTAPPGCARDD